MKAYNLDMALADPAATTELYIHNRGISAFPEAIFQCPNLKVLDLSKNMLNSLPANLEEHLPALERLNLSENDFAIIPEPLRRLAGLKELNLSFNRLEEIKSLVALSNLEQLDLKGNRLKKLPIHFGQLRKLRVLSLGQNLLKRLPASFGQLDLLEKLELQYNRLGKGAILWPGLDNLVVLNLTQNKLKELPEGLGRCTQLMELNLSFNKLEELPQDLALIGSLRRLYVNGNRLKDWPGGLDVHPNIRVLDMGQNELEAFPMPPRLEHLWIAKNNIPTLPMALEKLLLLESLDVKGNPMEAYPEVLFHLPRLRKVQGIKQATPFIRFLEICRELDLDPSWRSLFWKWRNKESVQDISVPRSVLFEALRFPIVHIRETALQYLGASENAIPTKAKVTLAGKSRSGKQKLQASLEAAGFSWVEPSDPGVQIVVLGGKPSFQPAFDKPGLLFVTEQQLLAYSIRPAKAKLPTQKLGKMLMSPIPGQVALAANLLRGKTIPKELLNELYVAYRSAEKGKLKQELRDLLWVQAKGESQAFLRWAFPLSKVDSLKEQILQKTEHTDFDGLRIIQLLSSNSK